MALSPKLEIRQGQSLVMTPQLMQAIKLLQMSSMDILAYVEAEVEKNPLLERDEEHGEALNEAGDADAPDADSFADKNLSFADADEDWSSPTLEVSAQSIAEKFDTDIENVFPEEERRLTQDKAEGSLSLSAPQSQTITSSGASSDDAYNPEDFLTAPVSLHEHLEGQLHVAITDLKQRLIGQFLIDHIDETGYFTGNLDEIAEKIGASHDEVEAILLCIQTFDPSGIAARDLKECLALQLREKNRFDPAMATLLAHLDLLAKRDIATLRRLCAVDGADMSEMIAEIKALTPKPGLAFGFTPVQSVVPDVEVSMAQDGSWRVELNTQALPKVLVNQSYYATISRSLRQEADRTYLSDCFQNATWLIKSLDQRAKTILKVASEIVRQQDAFFAYGVQHLRPINLKVVADQIAMHESTVSRVTAGKYMATPRGLFEMKYFFTAAIASAHGGEAHSAESVRHRIRQMIDNEAATAILSDDTLVDMLKEKGIEIARRTVAKYRESMKIPSSVERRREKMSALTS